MQFKLSFAILALSAFATANTLERRQAADPNAAPATSCNTGSLQCCQSVTSSNDPSIASLLENLGVAAQGDVTVGITCTPLTETGLQSGACATRPVCCNDVDFNGVVALGCTPIN